ncbi:MAG: ribonuclease HI [Methylobacterium frigidaeris]
MADEPIREITITFYGGCRGNPGPGDYRAVLVNTRSGRQKEVTGRNASTTANRMELTAAIQGLNALQPGAVVHMVGNSQYVVRGMNLWLAGWKANNWRGAGKKKVSNVDLWAALDAAASKHLSVTWREAGSSAGERERLDPASNHGQLPATRGNTDASWIEPREVSSSSGSSMSVTSSKPSPSIVDPGSSSFSQCSPCRDDAHAEARLFDSLVSFVEAIEGTAAAPRPGYRAVQGVTPFHAPGKRGKIRFDVRFRPPDIRTGLPLYVGTYDSLEDAAGAYDLARASYGLPPVNLTDRTPDPQKAAEMRRALDARRRD